MQLTKHTDYAFRVLIYLAGAQKSNKERSTILEISKKFDISKTHVMKIVNELANAGWVQSTRGKNGGIALGAPTKSINLKDVVVKMENTLNPIKCSEPMCLIKGICRLKPILNDAQSEFLNHLAKYTLSDLIDQPIVEKFVA
ncbi:MAG: RrF2 family transcriptional regulator [Arenicella sp.]